MKALLFYLATLGAIVSASLVLPALVAYGAEENSIGTRLLMYAATGGFVCTATLLAILGRVEGLSRNLAIILAIVCWAVFPAAFAVPVADVAQIGYVDALFQTISSFTTTGAFVFENADQVPQSLVFLLSQFQWMGGFATLVTLVLVLAPWEIGGLPQVASASIATSIVASKQRLAEFCGSLLRMYTIFTLICFFLLIVAGLEPFDAIVFAFTALSTGALLQGSVPFDQLLGNAGMIIVAFFLILGATSIFWHQDLLGMRIAKLRRHRESYFVIATTSLLAVFFAYALVDAAGPVSFLPVSAALPEGMFNAASIVSTSGMQSRQGMFALLPATLILMVAFAGAGCYSTSGGLKYFRIGGMYSMSEDELNRLIYPSSVWSKKFGDTEFDVEFMKSMWSFFAVLIASLAVITGLISLSGLAFQPAFTATVAAITNTGPLYGSFWEFGTAEDWPTYASMTASQKLLLSFAMFIGRLEIIAVFASITVFIRSLR